jgi:hypothetical protein
MNLPPLILYVGVDSDLHDNSFLSLGVVRMGEFVDLEEIFDVLNSDYFLLLWII